jgi:hypothetical protein
MERFEQIQEQAQDHGHPMWEPNDWQFEIAEHLVPVFLKLFVPGFSDLKGRDIFEFILAEGPFKQFNPRRITILKSFPDGF